MCARVCPSVCVRDSMAPIRSVSLISSPHHLRSLVHNPVPFGYQPHESMMGHTYHNPEITGRSVGPAATPPEKPHSIGYWKMTAPHLDPKKFIEASSNVIKYGSVTKAARALTPTKASSPFFSLPAPVLIILTLRKRNIELHTLNHRLKWRK